MRSGYLNSVFNVPETPPMAVRVKPEDVLQCATADLAVTVAEILQSPLFDECDLRLIAKGELNAAELRGYIVAWLKHGRRFPFPLT